MTREDWQAEIDRFVRHLKRDTPLAANSVAAYRNHLRRILEFSGGLTKACAIRFSQGADRRWAIKTVSGAVDCYNKFVEWSKRPRDKVRHITITTPPSFEHVPTRQDVDRLVAYMRENGARVRDVMFVRFLGATGARISEVLRVTVGDVRRGYSEQIGKGRKLRRILIPRVLAGEIASSPIADNVDDRWPLFRRRGFHGRNFKPGRPAITSRWACDMLHDWSARAGLDAQSFHPHAFRHYFAKEVLKASGNDVALVCDLLGHSDLKTTSKYLKLSQSEQRSGLDRFVDWA